MIKDFLKSFMWGVIFVILWGIFAISTQKSHFRTQNPVLCIIGEAEDQGLDGVAAVACAIQNRQSLEGVCGCTAKRVEKRLYSPETLKVATKAWELARTRPDVCDSLIGRANSWRSLDDLRVHGAPQNCMLETQIKDHVFYYCF